MLLRSALAMTFVLFFAVSPSQAAAKVSNESIIISFNDWKMEKTQVAQQQIASVRAQQARYRTAGQKTQLNELDKQLSQLQWNLDVANDLSIADYLALYLSRQTSPDRFKQAAARMTTKEVADLMEAYSLSMGVGSPEERAFTASSSPFPSLPAQASEQKGP